MLRKSSKYQSQAHIKTLISVQISTFSNLPPFPTLQTIKEREKVNLEIRNIKRLQVQTFLAQKIHTQIGYLHAPLQAQPFQLPTPNRYPCQPNIGDPQALVHPQLPQAFGTRYRRGLHVPVTPAV